MAGESGAEQGELGVGFGATGRDLAAELDRLRAYTLNLGEILEDLRAKYNAHTHVENAAARYTRSAGHANAAGRRTKPGGGNPGVAGVGCLVASVDRHSCPPVEGAHTAWQR